VETNDGSKENVKDRNIGIGVGIPALIVIIIIIIIIVLANKRGNKRDNAKTPKHDNSKKTWEPTVNKTGTPENTTMPHSKPWDHTVNAPGNPENVYMQNEHHVDYERRNYSGNPQHEPLSRLPPRRNYYGSSEHEPLPRQPPTHYDRRNDHDSNF
jgi:FtsZ-interacting cell division protein ZipA